MSKSDLKEIALACPVTGEEEERAVVGVLRSGWLTQGPEVAAFEAEFAAKVGAKHACAVSSGTTGLHLALLAAGVKAGDEGITASSSFIATANSIRYCGATPVFVDVAPGTFNLNPAQVKKALTPLTRAILAVHQIGFPCDMDQLVSIAAEAGIKVIEDAACAAGSRYRGALIGRPHGQSAVFSFHPRKVLTTGDGGMITTSDPELDTFFRRARQHGMSINDLERHKSNTIVFESYPELGFNYRMTDLQAAVGRVQLTRLDTLIEGRRRIADRYQEAFGAVNGLLIPAIDADHVPNWQSYCLRVLPSFRISRNSLMEELLGNKIASRRGVMCTHRETPYRQLPLRFPLPESERIQDEGVMLPIHSLMSAGDAERVIATVLGRS